MRKLINESKLLTEASLERLRQHLDKKEPIAFISATITDFDAAESKLMTHGLYHYIRAYQFGYNKINGGCTMDDGEFAEEQSAVVYAKPEEQDELFEFAKKAADFFEQESILLVETSGQAYFYYTKRSKVIIGDI